MTDDHTPRGIARSPRVAVIGLGEAGGGIHLPAVRGIPDATISGAADPDQGRREEVARRFAVPVFGDVRELLDQSKPDLVIVASPPAMHASHCAAALKAGADVLCEKPFAASVREGREILALAASLGRHVTVNHEFRAMPVFRDVLARVRADGHPPTVVQLWQAIHHNPAAEGGWRGQLRRRSLYEAGVHLVDLALALFGETPHAVSATFAAAGGATSAADAVVLATLRFSRGRLAQLVQCRVHRGDRQYLEFRADTAVASYRASFGGRARVSLGFLRSSRPHVLVERGASGFGWREDGARRTPLARNGGTPLITATRDVIRTCIATLVDGAPAAFPAAVGVEVLRVVAAAYLAAESGRVMELDGSDRDSIESLALAEVAG